MKNILSLPTIHPYMGISRDETKQLDDGRKFRIIVYGAYNALGLIGPENNGIAILDEQKTQVLCDKICCQTSGYFGPSDGQLLTHRRLMESDDKTFVGFINNHQRSRYMI